MENYSLIWPSFFARSIIITNIQVFVNVVIDFDGNTISGKNVDLDAPHQKILSL
jgi:hypothetical protein